MNHLHLVPSWPGPNSGPPPKVAGRDCWRIRFAFILAESIGSPLVAPFDEPHCIALEEPPGGGAA